MGRYEEEKILLFLKDLAENDAIQQAIAGSPNLEEARMSVAEKGYDFEIGVFRKIMLETFYFLICAQDNLNFSSNPASNTDNDEISGMLEYSYEFGVPIKSIPLKVFCFLSGE